MRIEHFEELRQRINVRLDEIQAPHRAVQIRSYPWLYGALGEVPSDAMFICENPSLAGVVRAHVETVDGHTPDIEAQWWGGSKNPAAKRFRVALHRLGLKTTPSAAKGGWRCYITNVIKEMNVAGDNDELPPAERRQMALTWAPVLAWEIDQVKPRHVFCVGNRAFDHVKRLVAARQIPKVSPIFVNHYSGRAGDAAIIDGIVRPVARALGLANLM
jgi:hypothetical protein